MCKTSTLHVNTWVYSMYTETISSEIFEFSQCIETKPHQKYLSLLTIFFKNLTRDTWVFQDSPPWRWIYKSSVGEFQTVNVRKQEVRKSCSQDDLPGISLTFNLCFTFVICCRKKIKLIIDMHILNVSHWQNCTYGEYSHIYAFNFTKYAFNFKKWNG